MKSKTINNASRMAAFLAQAMQEVYDGSLDVKKGETIFNGAGKWINTLRLKFDYTALKKISGEIKEMEDVD